MSYDIYNKTELTGVSKLLDEKHVQCHNVCLFYVNSLVISAIMIYEKWLTVWLTGIVCNMSSVL